MWLQLSQGTSEQTMLSTQLIATQQEKNALEEQLQEIQRLLGGECAASLEAPPSPRGSDMAMEGSVISDLTPRPAGVDDETCATFPTPQPKVPAPS